MRVNVGIQRLTSRIATVRTCLRTAGFLNHSHHYKHILVIKLYHAVQGFLGGKQFLQGNRDHAGIAAIAFVIFIQKPALMSWAWLICNDAAGSHRAGRFALAMAGLQSVPAFGQRTLDGSTVSIKWATSLVFNPYVAV